MSWNSLKSTFSQVRATHSFKRDLANIKTPKRKTNFPVIQAKRPRLNATENTLQDSTDDSDESIVYDPDYDDYCNGCLNRSVKEILPIVTRKSPSSEKRSNLSPLGSSIGGNLARTNMVQDLSARRRKEPCKQLNWNPLEQTFREIESERRFLEKSIVTNDTEESENSEHILNLSLIQSTQSSRPSQDAHVFEQQTNHPAEKQSPSTFSRQLPDASSSNISFSKKIQCRRGGYVQKLRRVMNRHKSEYAFWYHAQRTGLAIHGVRAQIKTMERLYGRTVMTIVDCQGDEAQIIIPENEKYKIGLDVYVELDPHFYVINNKRFYLGYNKMMKV